MKRYVRAKLDLDELDAYGRQATDSHLRKLMDDDERNSDKEYQNYMLRYGRRIIAEESINRIYDGFDEIRQGMASVAERYNWSLYDLMEYLVKFWDPVYVDCDPNANEDYEGYFGFGINTYPSQLYIRFHDDYEGSPYDGTDVAYITVSDVNTENPEFNVQVFDDDLVTCISTILKYGYNFNEYSSVDDTVVKSETRHIMDELFSAIESRVQDIVRDYIRRNPPALQDS